MSDGWKRAEVAPKNWAGRLVWRWNEWQSEDVPVIERFPFTDYSRSSKHCGGGWFKRIPVPKTPPAPAKRIDDGTSGGKEE